MTTTHRHASHGTAFEGCLTICGLRCDSADTAYAHDAERVNCPECLNPGPSSIHRTKSQPMTVIRPTITIGEPA